MNEMKIRGAGKTANLRVWSQRVAECREEPRFAEVRVQQSENSVAATVRIGPAAVDVYTGADAETVAAIVRALTVC